MQQQEYQRLNISKGNRKKVATFFVSYQSNNMAAVRTREVVKAPVEKVSYAW
jgi:hypothetical protein